MQFIMHCTLTHNYETLLLVVKIIQKSMQLIIKYTIFNALRIPKTNTLYFFYVQQV